MKSIPLSEVDISGDTVDVLRKLGFTETGNFIESDDEFLAHHLTKHEFIDLAIGMAQYKAGLFWDKEREK